MLKVFQLFISFLKQPTQNMHSKILEGFRHVKTVGLVIASSGQLSGDHLEKFEVFAVQTATTAATVSNGSEWRQLAKFLNGWDTSTSPLWVAWVATVGTRGGWALGSRVGAKPSFFRA